MTASLEARLQRLEAKEAIRDLVTAFARGADAHCDPAQLAPLFTDDAVFDIGSFGQMTGGGKAIAETMHANNHRGFYWTLHYLISPVIRLSDDGNNGDVFCYLWELAASHPERGRKAYWVGGSYTANVVNQNGTWKFQRLNLHIDLLSPYQEGWTGPVTNFDEV